MSGLWLRAGGDGLAGRLDRYRDTPETVNFDLLGAFDRVERTGT